MDIKEIQDVVASLNEAIPDLWHGNQTLFFEFSSNSYCQCILFNGIRLWNDDDDERDYDDNGEHEPLLPFVKRRFNALCDSMNQIRFKD